jgi:hypothetical protein
LQALPHVKAAGSDGRKAKIKKTETLINPMTTTVAAKRFARNFSILFPSQVTSNKQDFELKRS